MPVYEIKSFTGLSDYEDKGIPGAFKFASNIDCRKQVDSLTCTQALKIEGAGVIVDLVYFWVKCSDGNTYGFGNLGKIYKRTSAGVITLVYTDPDGAITGAAEFPYSTGKAYLHWATATKLKKKEIPGLANWTDVSTIGTNLTSASWHTMREAGGALVICNAQYLAMVGYDASYTPQALDLVPGNLAKTIVERNGRSIIGTIRSSDSKGINGAIDAEVPLVQIGDAGEIFLANGVDTTPVKVFPGGGKVNPGGVANLVSQANFFEWEQNSLNWISKQSLGNMALFGVWGATTGYGGIYTYGRKNKNHPLVLNLEYSLDVDEIGAVESIDGVVLISYKSGATYGVKSVDSTLKAIGTYYGLDFKSPIKKPSNICNWKYAEILCDPLPSGASIEFHFKLDKTGSFIQAKTSDGDTKFDTALGKKAIFNIGADAQIFEPKVVLNPITNSSPIVYRIRIYFD